MKGNNKMILEGLDKYYAKTEKCMQCAKNMTCTYCTGLVKFSQTKNYGEVKKNEKNKYNKI